MTTLKLDQTETLARAFSFVLRKWLIRIQIEKINSRNKLESYKNCCATHDFCDSNMAMEEAWIKIFRKKLRLGSTEDMNLLNAAWDLAKKNEFYIDTKNK